MAGGPFFPFSALPITSGKVFPNVAVGSGERGLGVMASVDGDAIWRLRFYMPPTALPSGTGKLRLFAKSAATSGSAKVNAKWASIAMGESPDAASLFAEGTSTLTWAAADDATNGKYKLLDVTLDADTLVAGEIVAMDLTFETASWTLAVRSTWQAAIIFE